MIDHTEFVKVLATLAALFPRFDLKPETIEAYYAVLSDLPVGLLKAATLEYAAEDTPWFPSAGQLRSRAFELVERRDGYPTPGEAWAEALNRMSYYSPPKLGDFSHPLVKRALDAIGGNRVLCMTMENMLHTARARFIEAYKALVTRERAATRMLPQVREAVMRLGGGNVKRLGGSGEAISEEGMTRRGER